jgi:hypothetical protein
VPVITDNFDFVVLISHIVKWKVKSKKAIGRGGIG